MRRSAAIWSPAMPAEPGTAPGIDSSGRLAGNTHYGLGYADGADRRRLRPPPGQIEVKYTLYGDANLDGVVNGTDFGILAAHFGQQVTRLGRGRLQLRWRGERHRLRSLGGQLRPAGQRRRGGAARQRLGRVGFLRRGQRPDGRCAGAGMRPRPRPDDPCRPFPTPFSFFLILMLADVG